MGNIDLSPLQDHTALNRVHEIRASPSNQEPSPPENLREDDLECFDEKLGFSNEREATELHGALQHRLRPKRGQGKVRKDV